MKCERCGSETKGYELHDYCAHCSRNLCDDCMVGGRCPDSADHKHQPANHGEDATS